MELTKTNEEYLEALLKQTNKNGKVAKSEIGPCWEYSGTNATNGYKKYGHHLAHRLSYRIHNDIFDYKLKIRHKCNNRCCINPAHLEIGTSKDNRDDMTRDGTVVSITKKGFNNGNAKLTDEQVAEIKARPKKDQRGIAKEFGVSQAHIHRIQSGEARTEKVDDEDPKGDFFKRTVKQLKQVKDDLTKCWETTYARDIRSYKNKKMQAARIAYMLENDTDISEGENILHRCDNDKCINPDHLYLGTDKENKEDMKSRNRFAKGENHGTAKLSAENVSQIYLNKEKLGTHEWALKFKVSDAAISMIKNNKTWTHLTSTLIPSQNPNQTQTQNLNLAHSP
jgi:hypothetical protein